MNLQEHVIYYSTRLVCFRMCLHSLVRTGRGSATNSGTQCTNLCSALAVNAPPLPRTLACCAVAARRRLVARDPSCVRTRRLYTILCERVQGQDPLFPVIGSKVCVSPISSAGQSVGLMSLRPRVRAPHGAFLSWHYFAYVHTDLLSVSALYFNIIFRCFVYIRQCISVLFNL